MQVSQRLFGAPIGAAGVDVLERSSGNALSEPGYGTTAFFGVLKRGPEGVAVPIRSRREYDEIYGDPSDPRWHLDPKAAHLLPDAIDGYFANGGGAGTLWLTRLDLDGKGRKASVILKNRFGADALRISAANPGRWGGQLNSVASTAVIHATARTFTLVAPGVEANEFIGAEAVFSSEGSSAAYQIVANTAANPRSGEVIFTVAQQHNLFDDGITGPSSLSGTASYQRYRTLTGTISFALRRNLSAGTVSVNNNVVTGNATEFLDDLNIGDRIYVNGEGRTVESITSNTTLTVSTPFTTVGTNLTAQVDNLEVVGTSTVFQDGGANDLPINQGDKLYVTVNGIEYIREVDSVVSDTRLILKSGFPVAIASGTQARTDNLVVIGTDTDFSAQAPVGSSLVDPNRAGVAVRVYDVDTDTRLILAEPFSASFSAAELTSQNQTATVTLVNPPGQGLSVEVGQGLRYPQTHFSLVVRFNGNQVMNIPDASLDPADPVGLFIEPLVNDSNVAYRVGSASYPKYITAESLWTSAYTTNPETDCRPCNGSGQIVAIANNTIWTTGDFDYSRAIGSLLYPNPYSQPRGSFRVKQARSPFVLDGNISVSNNNDTVSGSGTNFLTVLAVGDYIYVPQLNQTRRVIAIASNTSLRVDRFFGTTTSGVSFLRAGHIRVDEGYDLTRIASTGDRFLVAFPMILERGYDGDTGNLLPFFFTKYADVDRNHLENAVFGRNQGLVRIACPGISDVTIQREYAFYASARAYEYRCEIPSTFTSVPAAEAFVVNEIGRDDFITVAFPSYGFVSNPMGAGDRMISLSGDIMGGESFRAVQVQGYHRPFAGLNAQLPRVVRLPYESNPNDEAVLNVSGIQPIKYQDGRVVVFGARSPSRSPTYDFTHIRRIQSNYVRIFLEARTLLELLFEPNQPELADQVIMILNNFARREYNKKVMTNYLSFAQAVQIGGEIEGQGVISDANAQDALVQIINGRLKIRFRYVPTGIVERLTIEAGPDILVAQFGNTLTQQAAA